MSLPSLADSEGQVAEPFETLEASGSSQEQIPLATLRKKALLETPPAIGSKRATSTVGVGDPPQSNKE